jgi:DNA-binding PadR family transcriptional regulator
MKHHGNRRRKIGTPRGMLRHITLIILKEGPMSGSEITEVIESYMDWKPSPGSIYPLLSNLQEEDLIKPIEDSDPTLKRFSLSEKGEKEIEIHRHHDKEIRNRSKNIRKLYWRLLRGMSEELHDSYSRLQDQIEATYDKISDFDRFQEILENTTNELKKLEKKNDEQS